jgi:hypothetical protein
VLEQRILRQCSAISEPATRPHRSLASCNATLAGTVENSNFLRQTSAEYVTLLLEIESRLEVEPKPLAGPEVARESKRRDRAHRPLAVHDLVDLARGQITGALRQVPASGMVMTILPFARPCST